ncbi:hypothetical protein HELRODRAFT_66153, partial [Helobdella robusta]|uniref:Peptidase M16 middle/third domain-containing protein n=1 Tax=Helobdella robusta TaxID=6412 RepID=T1FYH5_HELRO
VVFMGSQKYPESTDFDTFLKAHTGSTNAHTDYEKTHFHFEIHSKYLCQALDRQFFISPLMERKNMLAEATVVDREWGMSLQKERARFEQLLLTSMARPDHPVSKFMWGNFQTLVEIPARDKMDVYQALQDFRKKHYVAQNMTLAVYTDQNPAEVEECIRAIFQRVPCRCRHHFVIRDVIDPFDTPEFRKIYRIIPVLSTKELEITWSLPSMLKHYRCKPLYYLENNIGDQGDGSIFSTLRRRRWVVNMLCGNNGSSQDLNSCYSIFRILFFLTSEGLENVQNIITVVFQYLKLLWRTPARLEAWAEMYQNDLNEFKYNEKVIWFSG